MTARRHHKVGGTTDRGLGWEHVKQRQKLLKSTPDGTLCEECGEPMFPQTSPRELAADHSLARARGGTIADRLLHATCNIRRGDGTRRDLSTVTSRKWL